MRLVGAGSKRHCIATDLVVMHVFERVADHADAHVEQVRRRHFENLLGELLAVLVDLLRKKRNTMSA